MADPTRSPSVQSFASADSMSMPATSVPGSPFISSANTVPPEEDAPRVAAVEHDGPNAPEFVEPDAPETIQAHRFYLKDGNIKFKLDDGTLYNVHRYFFETHAPSFADEYLPKGGTASIKLPGVSSVDFERFLSVIYPSKLGNCDIHTVDEWTSVLRLATKWTIASLHDLAIEEIWPKASPFDKVVIAREFALGQEWLVPAFVDICSRPNWLIREEAERLGLHTVVEVGRIREESRETPGAHFDVLAAVRASGILAPSEAVEVKRNCQTPPTTSTTSLTTNEVSPTTSAFVGSDPRSPAFSTSSSAASSSPPVTAHSLPPEQSSVADLIEEHAYQALLSAETAEEEMASGTPLNRALFALHLARRMANETTPAARWHRQWRQARVNETVRKTIAGEEPPPTGYGKMMLSGLDDERNLRLVHKRLAYLLCAKMAAEDTSFPDPVPGSELDVLDARSTGSSWIQHALELGLRREGWGAAGWGDRCLRVAIPRKGEIIPNYATKMAL
ncbi:hypothetical protein EV121DRAFT_292934 [Schizophyllum commune]